MRPRLTHWVWLVLMTAPYNSPRHSTSCPTSSCLYNFARLQPPVSCGEMLEVGPLSGCGYSGKSIIWLGSCWWCSWTRSGKSDRALSACLVVIGLQRNTVRDGIGLLRTSTHVPHHSGSAIYLTVRRICVMGLSDSLARLMLLAITFSCMRSEEREISAMQEVCRNARANTTVRWSRVDVMDKVSTVNTFRAMGNVSFHQQTACHA